MSSPTPLYFDNFETDTTGALPPGWTQLTGTYVVGTVNPINGSKSFGDSSNATGTLALYTGIAAQADFFIQQTEKMVAITGSATGSYHQIFRANSGYTAGYQFGIEYSSNIFQINCYKKTGATYTGIGTPVALAGKGWAAGDLVVMETIAVGTSFQFRAWKIGTARPSSADMVVTDSTYTAAGYAGLYRGIAISTPVAVDDYAIYAGTATASTTTALSGPATGNVSVASTNFTVSTDGVIPGVLVVTPNDSSGGGTFTPTTVSLDPGTPTATFTYTPGSPGGKSIALTNNGGLSNPAASTYTVGSSAATAVTMSGPTSGAVSVASTNFTVGANGTITGTVVVTPNDSSGGGTFSPTTVSISSGSPTGTFTYTAASAGAKTIAVTNNGSLTNPSTSTYTASSSSVVTFPVTTSTIFFSPYNWYSDGAGSMQANNINASSTFAWSNNRGAYMRFKATVGASGTIKLNVDTTSLASVANAAGCPTLAWSIGGGAIQSVLLASGNTQISLATGLSAGTYECFVAFRSVYITQDGGVAGCYTTPNNRVQVTGLELSTGGTLSAPTLKSKRMVIYGDSITEGDINVNGSRSASSQDATQTYATFLSDALDAEVGIVAWYGQTWSFFASSFDKYAASYSRLSSGLLLPAPDYVVITYGENDGDPGPASATVTTNLASVAATAPTAKIVLNIPFSGRARTNLSAATLPTNCVRIDTARYEMTHGNLQWSFDGQHPNVQGHANLAGFIAKFLTTTAGGYTGASIGGFGFTSAGQVIAILGA